MIADCTAPKGSKERDLAWQVEQVWCDDEDITRDCYFFDTDTGIAMCWARSDEDRRFKYAGEREAARIIKIGKIKYQLRKGETRTSLQMLTFPGDEPDTVGDKIGMQYDPATGQLTREFVVPPWLPDGFIADKVFPLIPVDDPKDPKQARNGTLTFDNPVTAGNTIILFTYTGPNVRLERDRLGYFIASTVA